jgi:hypothetical protein
MFLIECALVLAALLIAFSAPTLGSSLFEIIEQTFACLARKRLLSVVVVGLTALALRAALLPIEPIPAPRVHDEFSYLLAADTFAHGRLANPTHPMWRHFETFHVLQRPTYVSKYPPAQGLVLAAGQVILGHPFWGVWLSVGVTCAAVCWMLGGWLPPTWAMLGGLLAAIRIGSFSYWANSYWGGAVAALGGALVLGAWPRIKRSQRVRDALLMGVGLAILANTRPYEGLFLSAPVGIAFLFWICGKKSPPLQLSMRRIVLPLGAVILVAGGAMVYYFWRTTGSPFLTPYHAYQTAYDPMPIFPWQSRGRAPEYQHAVMRNFHVGFVLDEYTFAVSHPVWRAASKAIVFWLFFVGPVFTLPLLLSVICATRKAVFFLLILCVCFLGMLLPIYFKAHYAAPMTSAVYALILITMRRVRHWRCHGEPTGLSLTRAIPAICVVMLLLRAASGPLHIPTASGALTWYQWDAKGFGRATILSELRQLPERHLVIVRYGPEHDLHKEWVYNEADIDHAKVVWARDIGGEQNEELLRYYKDRCVWLLDADEAPPKLSSYLRGATGEVIVKADPTRGPGEHLCR